MYAYYIKGQRNVSLTLSDTKLEKVDLKPLVAERVAQGDATYPATVMVIDCGIALYACTILEHETAHY